jgi:hypothetical protein
VILGSSLSVMITVNEHVAELPLASVTLNVLAVVPTGNVAPLARPAVCKVDWTQNNYLILQVQV